MQIRVQNRVENRVTHPIFRPILLTPPEFGWNHPILKSGGAKSGRKSGGYEP